MQMADVKLNVRSLWDAATARSGEKMRLGDVLHEVSGPTSVVKVQTLARALFDSAINEETRSALLTIAQKIRGWKHFESLDWRTRAFTKMALARIYGYPTVLITALECCKSFFRAISLSRLLWRPVAPMLDKEIEHASRRQAASPQPAMDLPNPVDNDDEPQKTAVAVSDDEASQSTSIRDIGSSLSSQQDPVMEQLCAQKLIEARQSSLQMGPRDPAARSDQTSFSVELIKSISLQDIRQFHDRFFASIDQEKLFFKDPSYSLAQKTRFMGYAMARGRASMRDVQDTVALYEIRLAHAFLKHVDGAVSSIVDDYLSEVLGKSRRVWARVIREGLGLTGHVRRT